MLKAITAIERDGFDVHVITVVCEVNDKDFDLKEAICKACTEFLRTEDGKAILEYSCGSFNLADFDVSVPNSFCEPFGFRKVETYVEEEELDWDENLYNQDEIR